MGQEKNEWGASIGCSEASIRCPIASIGCLNGINWMLLKHLMDAIAKHPMDAFALATDGLKTHPMDAVFTNECKASKTGGKASENALQQIGMAVFKKKGVSLSKDICTVFKTASNDTGHA